MPPAVEPSARYQMCSTGGISSKPATRSRSLSAVKVRVASSDTSVSSSYQALKIQPSFASASRVTVSPCSYSPPPAIVPPSGGSASTEISYSTISRKALIPSLVSPSATCTPVAEAKSGWLSYHWGKQGPSGLKYTL